MAPYACELRLEHVAIAPFLFEVHLLNQEFGQFALFFEKPFSFMNDKANILRLRNK